MAVRVRNKASKLLGRKSDYLSFECTGRMQCDECPNRRPFLIEGAS